MHEERSEKDGHHGGHDGAVVQVTVTYVGKEDFKADVPGSEVLRAIKVRAMQHWGLNPGDQGRYVLQVGGADVAESTKVGELGKVVVLKLMLAEEPAKG